MPSPKGDKYIDYGVPKDFGGLGIIRCQICGRPYRDHALTERCGNLRGTFSTEEITARQAYRVGRKPQKKYKGIPQTHLSIAIKEIA